MVGRLALTVVAVLTVFTLCGCAGGSMGSYRLGRDAASLGSFAVEGQLLAQAAARGRAPAAYTAAHASEVGADCGDLASVVASTRPEPVTERARARLLVLARRATVLFESLEHAPNDEPGALRIAAAFGKIGAAASRIESSA
jgi:hypothetical protein